MNTAARPAAPDAGPDRGPGRLDQIVARGYPAAQKALVAVPLLAFAGPFASIRPGSPGFPYFYRILFVLGLVVAVPLFLTQLRRRLFPALFTVLVAVWIVWAPVSLLWTSDRAAGQREVLAGTSALLGAWVTLILTRGSHRSLRYLRWGWVLTFVVTVLVVAWEIVSWRHLGELTGAVEYWAFDAYTVAGLDTNPNGLSNVVNAVVAVMGAQLIREVRARRVARAPIEAVQYDGPPPDRVNGRFTRGSWWRIAALLAGIVVAGYLSLLTNSRSGILVVAILCLLAAVFCLPPRRYVVVPVALALIAGTVLALEPLPADAVRAQPTAQPTDVAQRPSKYNHEGMTPEEAAADLAAADSLRRDLSLSGLRQVEQRPLQGAGAGAATERLAADPDYQPGKSTRERRILPLHNTFLELAVNYGVPFLLLVLAIPLAAAAAVLRPRELRRYWPDPIVYECLGMLLSVLVMSLISSSSIGTPVFWLMLAYAAALAWNYTDTLTALRATGAPVSPERVSRR